MQSVKQVSSIIFWVFDSTWDWTLVSLAIGEHFTHLGN